MPHHPLHEPAPRSGDTLEISPREPAPASSAATHTSRTATGVTLAFLVASALTLLIFREPIFVAEARHSVLSVTTQVAIPAPEAIEKDDVAEIVRLIEESGSSASVSVVKGPTQSVRIDDSEQVQLLSVDSTVAEAFGVSRIAADRLYMTHGSNRIVDLTLNTPTREDSTSEQPRSGAFSVFRVNTLSEEQLIPVQNEYGNSIALVSPETLERIRDSRPKDERKGFIRTRGVLVTFGSSGELRKIKKTLEAHGYVVSSW